MRRILTLILLLTLEFRLECLIATGDETCDAGDLELIQHMNVDMLKLTRLLNGNASSLRLYDSRSVS